jgi:enoyl-CoA hydratase
MPAARAIAASIVGNNQKSVRALLESYHRIDEAGTGGLLWMEAEAARAWMRSASGDDIAASRASVIERGRSQVN